MSELTDRLRSAAAGPLWDDQLAAVRQLLTEAAERIEQLEPISGALPPIEATQPCFKCGRIGPLVIDRYAQRYDMRNHPERFMHAMGVCPELPDAQKTEPVRSPSVLDEAELLAFGGTLPD